MSERYLPPEDSGLDGEGDIGQDDDTDLPEFEICPACDEIARDVSEQTWNGLDNDRASLLSQSLTYYLPRLLKMREVRDVHDTSDRVYEALENFVESGLVALTRYAEDLCPEA